MPLKALITGITGQDGSYLAEFLLEKGYKVFGLVRHTSTQNYERIKHILDKVEILHGDLLDQSSLQRALAHAKPDEIYNLAALSFVPTSFQQPALTAEITGLGVMRLLEAMRSECPKAKFYQAGSSEMFGEANGAEQDEKTPFHPRSPYAAAKAYAHHMTVNYRESYRLFAVSGILFNHESPRRGKEFVTRKITDGVARIKRGLSHWLMLGNLHAIRDWGYAPDYVRAMWLMLQNTEPKDYVIATGVSCTVKEFAKMAFETVGLNPDNHIKVTSAHERPAEVYHLCGNATAARTELNWHPGTDLETMISIMVNADLSRYKA